jgi:hypothetical protein
MMPRAEHRIRLRGGWECHYRDGDDESAPDVVRRVDLPLGSPSEIPLRCRLTRQFGRPPVDPRSETVSLELRNVEGLKSAWLNGRPIGEAGAGGADVSIVLPEPLLPRNGLVLEIARPGDPWEGPSSWGEIALVIRPR